MNDTSSSYSGSFTEYDEGKTIKLYRSLAKMLEEVQKTASEVKSNYKALEGNMNLAAKLITAIQSSEKQEVDVPASDMMDE